LQNRTISDFESPTAHILFKRLEPLHQQLVLELIDAQSIDNNYQMTMEDFFLEIILSYLAETLLPEITEKIALEAEQKESRRRCARIAVAKTA
jgi:hypothetical protein